MKNFKKLLFDELYLLDIKHNKLALIFGCVALTPLIGFLPSFSALYRLLMIVVCIWMISRSKRLDIICIFLLLGGAVSIFLASPDPLFKSWFRYGLFVLLFTSISPLIRDNNAVRFKRSLLQLMLFVSIIVSIVSFVFYF